jgi:hypothetical protein
LTPIPALLICLFDPLFVLLKLGLNMHFEVDNLVDNPLRLAMKFFAKGGMSLAELVVSI